MTIQRLAEDSLPYPLRTTMGRIMLHVRSSSPAKGFDGRFPARHHWTCAVPPQAIDVPPASILHVPGPPLGKISWYYIAWYDFWLRRNDKIAQWHLRYGPVICFRPGEVSFASSGLMREIYGTAGKYTKSELFENFMVYGQKPLFSIGPYWEHRKKRMLISSFYHKTSITRPVMEKWLRQNIMKLVAQIERAIVQQHGNEDKAPAKAMLDAYPLFNCFAFDNITHVLFGSKYGAKTIANDCPERKILLGIKQAQMWGPFKFNFPALAWITSKAMHVFPTGIASLLVPDTLRLCLKSEDEMASWNWNTLQTALADLDAVEDYTLLQRMLSCRAKAPETLETPYIAAELYDNINAAQETVAVGLIYLIFHLARQHSWQARIRSDLLSLNIAEDGFPAWTDIDKLSSLDAFMREALRVNPGASGRQERYIEDSKKDYNGICLPIGTRVTASTIALHQDPSVFPHPEEFRPERWLDQTPETLRQMENSFIPFGYGARICLGKALGIMELKMLAAFLLLRYEIATTPEMGDGKSGPMWQCGSIEAVPIGLKGEMIFTKLDMY
ncbi:predicted protein [Uncinocarpus reesii 1704]|uniref:Benzoate 4-monooxygenase cytochrome P450 n=1 Tax=Uncinocarpus reesii (strain UAMH 1704) TaxID=336963 RepID=C4JMY8_UNCRE|nr:uncharacterized protein UREG_04196 [Uncinocarpus reesii 1704]EEP79350.1 predicted protein [Uncinocarpus reesii 1704]